MIDRRKFIKLVAGGLVVSQWPGALFDVWGQAVPIPETETIQMQGRFEFDLTEHRLFLPLLSLDGTGVQAIQFQCATNPAFELLPSAEGDGYLAAVEAINNLPARNPLPDVIDHFFLYIFAQGCAENLQRLAALAKKAKSVCSFIVALIVETEDTDTAQWSAMSVDAGLDSLCLVSPAGLGPGVVSLAPELAHQPMELAYLTALRAHTDLFWNTGPIGIDYFDYKAVVKGIETGRLGFGCVEERVLCHLATQKALAEVAKQGIDLTQVRGCWVTIFSGSDWNFEEFDAVCEVIHGALANDANVIIGMSLGEEFTEKFTVTVLAG